MTQPIAILLFGAGNRGNSYAQYALDHPDEVRFAGVAEPVTERREQFAARHGIPAEHVFESWQDALLAGKFADAVLDCTQDGMHHESGMAALRAGYDMLLEKPIAPTLAQAAELVETAETLGRALMICHVLRYTEFFEAVAEHIQHGDLGRLITVAWRENVAAFHMAHSYVRGNWRSTRDSAPMILAKCCHDLDLLHWYLGEPVQSLGSSGSLLHYRPENAPAGAPLRCTDGCPVALDCPYYAPAIYRDMLPIKYSLTRSDKPAIRAVGKLVLQEPGLVARLGKVVPAFETISKYYGWPRSVITDHPEDDEAVMRALREGPYGRCVYHCDNDVVDQQVVLMTTPSGVSASLTMHGHSHEEGRTIRLDGSKATLLGKFSLAQTNLELWDKRGFLLERRRFGTELDPGQSGHGGGDAGIMAAFVGLINGRPGRVFGAREALESHILAFAAEEARLEYSVVNLQDFKDRHGLA